MANCVPLIPIQEYVAYKYTNSAGVYQHRMIAINPQSSRVKSGNSGLMYLIATRCRVHVTIAKKWAERLLCIWVKMKRKNSLLSWYMHFFNWKKGKCKFWHVISVRLTKKCIDFLMLDSYLNAHLHANTTQIRNSQGKR